MFAIEWVQRCAVCDDLTPHRRERLQGRRLAAAASAIVATVFAFGVSRLLAWAALLVALVLTLRAVVGSPPCQRCAAKRAHAGRLGRGSEISILP